MDKSNKISNIIERYNKLNEEGQNKVIDSLAEYLNIIEGNIEQDKKEDNTKEIEVDEDTNIMKK